ncbi:unnamed protein product, partial [Iphiclides podalirius]
MRVILQYYKLTLKQICSCGRLLNGKIAAQKLRDAIANSKRRTVLPSPPARCPSTPCGTLRLAHPAPAVLVSYLSASSPRSYRRPSRRLRLFGQPPHAGAPAIACLYLLGPLSVRVRLTVDPSV